MNRFFYFFAWLNLVLRTQVENNRAENYLNFKLFKNYKNKIYLLHLSLCLSLFLYILCLSVFVYLCHLWVLICLCLSVCLSFSKISPSFHLYKTFSLWKNTSLLSLTLTPPPPPAPDFRPTFGLIFELELKLPYNSSTNLLRHAYHVGNISLRHSIRLPTILVVSI